MPTKAGGVIFVSTDTKRICLVLRSSTSNKPLTWSAIGGKINKNEKILQGISRELREEIGFIPKYLKIFPIDVYKNKDFTYYSLVVVVENEFTLKLNDENISWGWFHIDYLPKPLHPGAKQTLLNENFKQIIQTNLHN